MHLISAMFDSQRVIDDYMDLNQWRTCYRSLLRVVFLLHDNKALTLGVMPNDDDGLLSSQISKDFLKRRDDDPDEEKPDDKTGPIRIVGSLETFLVRLEDEYTKSLQQINPHTQVRRVGYVILSLINRIDMAVCCRYFSFRFLSRM